MDKLTFLENRKKFLNNNQLIRLRRWNGDLDTLTFFYHSSHHHIGYHDDRNNRYNTNFRWHDKINNKYIVMDKDNMLIEKIADGELEYLNKRCFTYNRVVALFNLRDDTLLPPVH